MDYFLELERYDMGEVILNLKENLKIEYLVDKLIEKDSGIIKKLANLNKEIEALHRERIDYLAAFWKKIDKEMNKMGLIPEGKNLTNYPVTLDIENRCIRKRRPEEEGKIVIIG